MGGAPQRNNYSKCPDIHVVSKHDLYEETKCEQCEFNSKSSSVLRTHLGKHYMISQDGGVTNFLLKQ